MEMREPRDGLHVAPKSRSPVRVYRLYNIDQGRNGEPFGMCDECMDGYRVEGCLLRKVADKAIGHCEHPGHESD
jgi:hypothetical protein